MAKRDLLRRKVEDIDLSPSSEVARLVEAMGRGGGFTAKKIALGVERLGNVLIPNASYGIVLEKKIQPMLRDLWDSGVRAPSSNELLWELGRRTGSRQSFLWWAWKNRIPVVVPAMFDGAVGYQVWSFWQEHKEFA